MKARFLLFLLFAILLQVNTSSFAREMKTARRIELRVKAQAQHRSILISPVASVEGSLVSMEKRFIFQNCHLRVNKKFLIC